MRIIFFGTPPFSVPSLNLLVKRGYQVVAVVTSLDKPAGRGLKTQKSAVKRAAEGLNIPILQPKNLKSKEFINSLSSFNADLQIVIAFRMLPEVVWNMPKLGTINLHASLLPDYRGAAPINWAIMNGERKTGLTTFKLKHKIDTGDILLQQEISIGSDMNAGELHNQMMEDGANLICQTVSCIDQGTATFKKQTLTLDNPKIAPKITKANCEINWKNPSIKIFNFIRGLSPYPCAWTKWENKTFKIKNVQTTEENQLEPGKIYVNENKLFVGTKDFALQLLEVQLEGKKTMAYEDFLRGIKQIPKHLGL